MTVRTLRKLVGWALVLMSAALAAGERRRDPLTQAGVDQVRDASWEPQQRLGLYMKVARSRLVALEQMRNDPKTKDRAAQAHDKLEDFLLIYDGINDNVDT